MTKSGRKTQTLLRDHDVTLLMGGLPVAVHQTEVETMVDRYREPRSIKESDP